LGGAHHEKVPTLPELAVRKSPGAPRPLPLPERPEEQADVLANPVGVDLVAIDPRTPHTETTSGPVKEKPTTRSTVPLGDGLRDRVLSQASFGTADRDVAERTHQ